MPDTVADYQEALIMIGLNDSAERINYPFQRIEDDTIIVNPKDRMMHQLNEVGSRIWELIAKQQTVSGIICAITDEFEVNPSAARNDIIQLLDKMLELKLIKVIHNE
jgi:hypothetical protein